MHEKYLQELGLTDKEALVYLALLQVDSDSVANLAKKTKIKRPTVYVVLGTLAKKGLVSEVTIGKKTNYQAESPERLETFVERQKILLDEKAKRLKDIIPELKATRRETGERPVVKYFEGKEGILSMVEEFSKSYSDAPEETMYLLYSRDLLAETFNASDREKFRRLRLGNNIKAKVLYTSLRESLVSDDMAERSKLDHEKYPITADIGVFNDKVRISILGKHLSGVFIQSKDFADTLKSLIKALMDSNKRV